MAVLPGSHAKARGARSKGLALEELAGQPFVLATGGCVVNAGRLMAEAGLHLSDVRVTVRDWVSACMLVREEMGVAIVPASTLPEDTRGLCVVPLTPALHREFGLVCSSTGKTSPAVQALVTRLCKAG